MSGWVLRLRARPPVRLDLSLLTPERLADQSAGDVAHIVLGGGGASSRVGDWFDVSGSPGDEISIEGACDRLDRIGAGMQQGLIRVHGDAGVYLGIGMRGGRIEVAGSVDAYAASGMSAGLIAIDGGAGDFLGGALPGEHRGMRGGVVVVRGDVRDRAADHMRRGLILIEGSCGDYCGARMQGGTIGLLGACGARAGYSMRRGTLLFMGSMPEPGATFGDGGVLPLAFLTLLTRSWSELPTRFAGLQRGSTRVHRWMGDLGFGGEGELIHWPG